jgi:hypothetical protein
MDSSKQQSGFHTITARAFTALAVLCVAAVATVSAQPPPAVPSATVGTDYVIGPQDVLTITSYDQADLSGKFAVETDGTFTYPMIGRVKAGGFTLRDVELHVKKQLKDGGYFNNPQITVAMETYKSQKIFVVGEVRSPGAVTLTGDAGLVEALARAGSTLPSTGGGRSSSAPHGRARLDRNCRISPRVPMSCADQSCELGTACSRGQPCFAAVTRSSSRARRHLRLRPRENRTPTRCSTSRRRCCRPCRSRAA